VAHSQPPPGSVITWSWTRPLHRHHPRHLARRQADADPARGGQGVHAGAAARRLRRRRSKSKKEASKKRFAVGSRLRVHTGEGFRHPFGGFYGQVVKVKGKGVVRAMINVFNGQVPMEFDPTEIKPAADKD
jgi:hypothetical protein